MKHNAAEASGRGPLLLNDMKKMMFLCHGNICRSPMAEYVMRDLVRKAEFQGLLKQIRGNYDL